LPRFRQRQVRETIQNELSVTRKLVHPHTIRIFFTYEENARFYIIMEPVADCDLEAFLIQHSSKPPTRSQRKLILKWFCCLANTLAFIHSKGIRHKDIKPRNILVKGEEVIFADFGSSHAFLEEGGSTTEGPSHGHTKMYCAPEVIHQKKRNRAADIFSLGCVFTELAVWLAGHRGLDIHSWHEHRATEIDLIKTSAYYASLDKVEQWFLTCATGYVRIIYNHVIGRMLCTDPDERLKVMEVSRRIVENVQFYNPEYSPCSKCRLGLWLDVPDDMVTQRPVVASTLDDES
jgi:serine/threonine protein kinase